MNEKYSERVLAIIQLAHQETVSLNHQMMGLWHMIKAVMEQEKIFLKDLGVNTQKAIETANFFLQKIPKVSGGNVHLDTETVAFFSKLNH